MMKKPKVITTETGRKHGQDLPHISPLFRLSPSQTKLTPSIRSLKTKQFLPSERRTGIDGLIRIHRREIQGNGKGLSVVPLAVDMEVVVIA